MKNVTMARRMDLLAKMSLVIVGLLARHPEEKSPALEDLLADVESEFQEKRGRPRGPSGKITEAEFAKATHGDGRGSGHKLTVRIYKLPQSPTQPFVEALEPMHVEWTCPNCGAKNDQHWYGRAYHICANCDLSTELKGQQ